ncbi:hypothetical protein CEE36_07770 [candidate division TA06 bacterium B3_TA06]|uniref:Leucine-rich repeat domain-containing protein n=1 Tax=candidate division TA06 bacterium B3_TA06 TaxID=2012487 RepID=A0A532V400_UNCT6|nr:MAG: hypothetical protein CEE36_07770 [candidate division TA06 bacterium B3_TA06]
MNVFKQITILYLTVLAGSITFCKKEMEEIPVAYDNPEPRWLVIEDEWGDVVREIDVADWEVGEDVILFVYHASHAPYIMPYFWQGEDTIVYFYDFEGDYIKVNGKVVGIEYVSVLESHPRADPDSILSCEVKFGRHVEGFREYLPNLRAVGISYTSHMMPWIAHIISIWDFKEIPEDIDLYFYYSGITNFELWKLSLIPNLKGLVVTYLEDRGLRFPRGLENLEKLVLNAPAGSDLRNIARLKNLKELGLSGEGVGDAELEYIANLENLRVLTLEGTSVTDSDLTYLKGLPNLRKLELSYCNLTDQGLKHIGTLEGLRELYLGGNQITDAGLDHLKGLIELQKLGLWETKVTSYGYEEFGKTMPGCETGYVGELRNPPYHPHDAVWIY